MLSDLHIENIAVIERADISFTKGLNVLTGETGAGKSIIIDSLMAVMGARTSRELVRAGAEKAQVTAVFAANKDADGWLLENELESDDELILQRRISEEGKSSCRVCGAPVSAAQLREISALLLDIHGQNDGRQLMDESRHRDYLDTYGGYMAERSAFAAAFTAFSETKKEIRRLSKDMEERERLIDTLNLTVDELDAANLRAGEEEELEARRELLRNSGKLTEAVNASYAALYGGEADAISQTEYAASELSRAVRYCEELSSAEKTLSDAVLLLRDAAETLRDFVSSLDFSPEEYDRIETRLSVLRRLTKKYGGDESALLKKLEQSRQRLDEMEYADDRLQKLQTKLQAEREAVQTAAGVLTKARERAGARLEQALVEQLRDLSMPSVSFQVDITPIDGGEGFDKTGGDQLRFLISANRGEKPGPISRIASGGELSRIMLAMKNVFSAGEVLGTLVFDEIDTGVSGVAASRVGEKLAELSRTKQVLCVTHLPQIAAMADSHYVIEKTEREGRTYTSVTLLDRDGRKRELARLHGGDNITENTLLSAGEQLDAAEAFKKKRLG